MGVITPSHPEGMAEKISFSGRRRPNLGFSHKNFKKMRDPGLVGMDWVKSDSQPKGTFPPGSGCLFVCYL